MLPPLTIREFDFHSHVGFTLNGAPLQEAGWVDTTELWFQVGWLQDFVLTQPFVAADAHIWHVPVTGVGSACKNSSTSWNKVNPSLPLCCFPVVFWRSRGPRTKGEMGKLGFLYSVCLCCSLCLCLSLLSHSTVGFYLQVLMKSNYRYKKTVNEHAGWRKMRKFFENNTQGCMEKGAGGRWELKHSLTWICRPSWRDGLGEDLHWPQTYLRMYAGDPLQDNSQKHTSGLCWRTTYGHWSQTYLRTYFSDPLLRYWSETYLRKHVWDLLMDIGQKPIRGHILETCLRILVRNLSKDICDAAT